MSRNGTVADLFGVLQKKANLDEKVIPEMRLFEAKSGKVYQEFKEENTISAINEYSTLYAARAPAEELNMAGDERLVSAYNFDREPNRTHGVPFKFVVKPVSATPVNFLIFWLRDD